MTKRKIRKPARPQAPRPTCVILDGPYDDVDKEGEEYPYWPVALGDANGEPIGTVYLCRSERRAVDLAERMATDRRLPIVSH